MFFYFTFKYVNYVYYTHISYKDDVTGCYGDPREKVNFGCKVIEKLE